MNDKSICSILINVYVNTCISTELLFCYNWKIHFLNVLNFGRELVNVINELFCFYLAVVKESSDPGIRCSGA